MENVLTNFMIYNQHRHNTIQYAYLKQKEKNTVSVWTEKLQITIKKLVWRV